jgi:hypothetical protein
MLDKILAFVKFSAARQTPASREHAPDAVRIGGTPFGIVEHFQRVNGYPILDWQEVRNWLDGLDASHRSQAWWACERAWLLHFRDALGPHYRLDESDTAAIVSSLDARKAQAALEFMGKTLRRIGRVLDGIAKAPDWGRDLLIVFESQEEYYQYVSHYYPEKGEFAFSAGMHIDSGCGHYVTSGSELWQIEPTLAHEMTHGCLGHLAIPLWLNEGLAVNTERRLAGAGSPLYTPEQLHAKHQRFWSPQTIQEFWSGKSFARPDEGNMLSYDLARILVEQFAASWGSFRQFVVHAERSDAGAVAAHEHLGLDLGAAVRAMLQKEGSWSPDPKLWE